jgi:tetratricopeptide (TPR) repeat protein
MTVAGSSRTRPPFLGRLAAVAISTALAFLAVEGGLRLIDARLPGFGFLSPFGAEPPSRLEGPFVLGVGESSMVGEPYDPKISLPGLVARELSRAFGIPVEARLAAHKGAVLPDLLPELSERLKERPALVVVMAGNNDFLGRFASDRIATSGAMRLYPLVRSSFLARLALDRYLRREVLTPPDPRNRAFFDQPVVTDAQRADILETFSAAASEIARRCRKAGVPAVFVAPAGDEVEIGPSRSFFRGKDGDRDRFLSLFAEGRAALEAERPCAAEASLRQAAALDPTFAAVSFRLAQALVAQGRPAEAIPFFRSARDHDGFPFRAVGAQREALRQAATRYGLAFVDAEEAMRRLSPSGLLDASLFHDAHHPSLAGYLAIARAVAEEASRADLLGRGARSLPPPEEAADVARAFSFGAEEGVELMRSRAGWLEAYGQATFDPADRLEFALEVLRGMRRSDPRRWAAAPALTAAERRVAAALEAARGRWRRPGGAPASCTGPIPSAGPLPDRWKGFPGPGAGGG